METRSADFPPGAQDFLRRACQIAQKFDEEGEGVLPVRCWRSLLQELDLDEESEGAFFLMDFVEPAGEALFTYEPLLEVLGLSLADRPPEGGPRRPAADEHHAPNDGQYDGREAAFDRQEASHSFPDDELDDDYRSSQMGKGHGKMQAFQHDDDLLPANGRGLAGGLGKGHGKVQQEGSYGFFDDEPAHTDGHLGIGKGHGKVPQSGYPHMHADGPSRELPPRGTGRAPVSLFDEPEGAYRQGVEGGRGNNKPLDLESEFGAQSSVAREAVDDVFWSKRGQSLQRLYCQWDSNRLTNEAFQARLQEVLGESVDIMHPDSEFLRLISKHRSARTMKFAQFMTGLRRDAHNTTARLTGEACVYGGASSYAGSAYEPSEVGSEAQSHAAGRASGGVPILPGPSRGGRRHFQMASDNPVLPRDYQVPRLGQLPEDTVPEFSQLPSSPAGAAPRAGYQGDFWSRDAAGGAPVPARAPLRRDPDRSDAVSEFSMAASEADSQRSAFSERNRTGHGNILSWGKESRAVTPPKQRTGRGLAIDPNQGVPRSQVTSGIFR